MIYRGCIFIHVKKRYKQYEQISSTFINYHDNKQIFLRCQYRKSTSGVRALVSICLTAERTQTKVKIGSLSPVNRSWASKYDNLLSLINFLSGLKQIKENSPKTQIYRPRSPRDVYTSLDHDIRTIFGKSNGSLLLVIFIYNVIQIIERSFVLSDRLNSCYSDRLLKLKGCSI